MDISMENGQTEETTEALSEGTTDIEEVMEEPNLEIAQLQGLVAELREGLRVALTELCELRQRDRGLEETLQAQQTDVDEKIMSLKNSLNTFKEELNAALFQIQDVSGRQREFQTRIEKQATENCSDVFSVANGRKSSDAEVLSTSEDERICPSSQSDPGVAQHFFPSLPRNGSSLQRSSTTAQTSNGEREAQPQQRGSGSVSPNWGERKNSRDDRETFNGQTGHNKRQAAALELLESERVYVSHLSLLLKANISFNGSEALVSKDKRAFPSSLRFLIQQHLELLHTLQERVLKSQWQGIMGDVFMRLTSKESDFLDFYVSYLKELPDCLTVVTMLASGSVQSSALLESDILGDEAKPPLHTLLLQPVQRIPDYLLLLQGLLRQTDADHPDYYLLLVCIQQFRSFTAQYHHLLQHNQELLLHNRKRSTLKQLMKPVEVKPNNMSSPYACSNAMMEHANQAQRSKQRLLEQMQAHHFQDWDREPGTHCCDAEWPPHLPYFNPELDSRNHKPTGLVSIPESEAPSHAVSCRHHLPSRPAEFRQVLPGSALADALGEFLLPPDPPGMESLYEEEGGSLHDVSVFDHCSSDSSDSSIDIAFVKCPKGPVVSHHSMDANVSSACNVYTNGGGQGNGYSKLPKRGCVSPDAAAMMRRNQHRPLQASQRKSKSLNGLQMDNTVGGLDVCPLSEHVQRVGLGSHAKLERQGSKGSRGCPTPSRKIQSPLGNRADADKQNEDHHGLLSIDSGIQSWSDDSRWRSEAENNPSAFSERSRKQDKGGFRSSFKKLFKKKSSDEKKDKGSEKTPEHHGNNHETAGRNPKVVHVEITRGTAV